MAVEEGAGGGGAGSNPVVSFNPSTFDVAKLKTISSNGNPAVKVDPSSLDNANVDSSGVGLYQYTYNTNTGQLTAYKSKGGQLSSASSTTVLGATTFQAATDFTSEGNYAKATAHINSGNSFNGDKLRSN